MSRWPYAGVVIGGAVSVLANVAHSYVRPDDAPADWHPKMGAVASSVFWPVALFVALEILVRTDWPRHVAWVAVKVCGLLPIGAVAAVVSYQHLSGLLTSYDESSFAATFGPVAVDGLMVISSAALLAGSLAASRITAEPVAEPTADVPVSPPEPVVEPEPAVLTEPEPAGEPVLVPTAEDFRTPLRSVSAAARPGRTVSRKADSSPKFPCDAGCGKQVSKATRTRHRNDGCPAVATA